MAEDFEKINKQVAAFIVVSSALVAPVVAAGISTGVGNMPASSSFEYTVKYAGPAINYPQPMPGPIDPVVKYAGPGIDTPVVSSSGYIARYAGPPGIDMPVVSSSGMLLRYAGPGIDMPTPVVESSSTGIIDTASRALSPESEMNFNNSESENVTDNYGTSGANKVAPGHFWFQ